jgi:hypothetical protein
MKDFNLENYPWSIDGLQQCIKENRCKAKIIAINGNKAIVKVESYGASQVLGAYSDWCISQHRCSWEQYVSNHPENIQIFFYDFDLKPTDNLSLVGATFTMANDKKSMSLMCCFTRENHPIGEKIGKGPKEDLEALNKLIANKNFGFEITAYNNPLFYSLTIKEDKVTFEEVKSEDPTNRREEMRRVINEYINKLYRDKFYRAEENFWDTHFYGNDIL